jgi:hypothetical protein
MVEAPGPSPPNITPESLPERTVPVSSRRSRLVHGTDDGHEAHEVAVATKPGGTAIDSIAPGANASGAFYLR